MNHVGNIIIGADDITLDCNGNMVSGTGSGSGFGIALNNRTKVTIKNCHVQDFDIGFNLFQSDRNKFHYNTAEGNNLRGFFLINSDKNKFEENIAEGNTIHGFHLVLSNNNTLEENTAVGNTVDGFRIFNSDNNTLEENIATDNDEDGFHVLGTSELNTLEDNEGMGNGDGASTFDALDESTGINELEDNDFGTSMGI